MDNFLSKALRQERLAFTVALRAALLPLTALIWRSERFLLWRLIDAYLGAQELYPQVNLSELMDRTTLVKLVDLPALTYNVSEAELLALAALTSRIGPETVFEIGTADGRTTRNLALNLNGSGVVFTLNLPLDQDPGHHQEVPVGHRFLDKPEMAQITQLWGDSASFNFAPYHGRCGVVFIDADHSDAGAWADSEIALRLVDRERGVILWHDATRYGVRSALPRFMQKKELPVHQLTGTSLALLCFAGGRALPPLEWASASIPRLPLEKPAVVTEM